MIKDQMVTFVGGPKDGLQTKINHEMDLMWWDCAYNLSEEEIRQLALELESVKDFECPRFQAFYKRVAIDRFECITKEEYQQLARDKQAKSLYKSRLQRFKEREI